MLTNGSNAEPKATSSVVRTSFTGERPSLPVPHALPEDIEAAVATANLTRP